MMVHHEWLRNERVLRWLWWRLGPRWKQALSCYGGKASGSVFAMLIYSADRTRSQPAVAAQRSNVALPALMEAAGGDGRRVWLNKCVN